MTPTSIGSPSTSVTRWFWMPLRWPGSSVCSGSRFSSSKQSLRAVGWRAARPIALLRDLHAAPPDLVAEFPAVLGGPEPLELDVDRVERVVFPGLADASCR